VLKKISVYSLIIVSISLTACSSNQVKKPAKPKKAIITQHKQQPEQQHQQRYSPSRKVTRGVKRPRAIRVVYEKRRPVFRQVVPRRRQYLRRIDNSFSNKLSNAALSRLRSRVRYDGSYYKIAYPWGDVPPNVGVCTDVVIRSYRRLGIDLQQQVHNDMSAAFSAYPNIRKWGLSKPDPNIDHRRVYNLRTFFQRRGAALPVTHNPRDYRPGDLVTWMVGKDLPHIGIVVNKRSHEDPNRFMIVHNIANGPQMEDVLFRFPITGHYRYTPAHMRNIPKPVYASLNRAAKPIRATRTTTSKSRQMDYRQLAAAAQLLGVHKTRTNSNKSKTRAASKKIKEVDPITLANLSNVEMQQILTIK